MTKQQADREVGIVQHAAYASIFEEDPDAVIITFDGGRWHVEPPGVEYVRVDAHVPDAEVRLAVARGDEGWQATELDPEPSG